MIIWWAASDTGWNDECRPSLQGSPFALRVKFLYNPLLSCVAPPKTEPLISITYKSLECALAPRVATSRLRVAGSFAVRSRTVFRALWDSHPSPGRIAEYGFLLQLAELIWMQTRTAPLTGSPLRTLAAISIVCDVVLAVVLGLLIDRVDSPYYGAHA